MNPDTTPFDFAAAYVGGYPAFEFNRLSVTVRVQPAGIVLTAPGNSQFPQAWNKADIYSVDYAETNCLYAGQCRRKVAGADIDLWEATREGGQEYLPAASLIIRNQHGDGVCDVRLAFASKDQAEMFILTVRRILGVGPL